MTGERKTAFLILRVSAELKNKLLEEALSEGISLSEKVRRMLEEKDGK